MQNAVDDGQCTLTLFRSRIKVTSTIASHSPLNISETVRDRGFVPKDHQWNGLWGNQSQSCDHAMTSRDPQRSNSWPQYNQSPIYSKTAGDAIQQQSLITSLYCEAVRSAILATAGLQVLVQWIISFTRLYLECAETYTLHILAMVDMDSDDWLQHDHDSQQLYGFV